MNLEHARETALHIQKGNWDQASWWSSNAVRDAWDKGDGMDVTMQASELLGHTCGTTGCVAGWTVAVAHPDAVFSGSVVTFGDIAGSVPVIAQDDLELTEWQADWLFNGNRELNQVLWALENDDPGWSPDDAPVAEYEL